MLVGDPAIRAIPAPAASKSFQSQRHSKCRQRDILWHNHMTHRLATAEFDHQLNRFHVTSHFKLLPTIFQPFLLRSSHPPRPLGVPAVLLPQQVHRSKRQSFRVSALIRQQAFPLPCKCRGQFDIYLHSHHDLALQIDQTITAKPMATAAVIAHASNHS